MLKILLDRSSCSVKNNQSLQPGSRSNLILLREPPSTSHLVKRFPQGPVTCFIKSSFEIQLLKFSVFVQEMKSFELPKPMNKFIGNFQPEIQ
jgi:hypothetical protein